MIDHLRRFAVWTTLPLLLALVGSGATAQEPASPPVDEPPTVVEPAAIPAAEIPTRAVETADVLLTANSLAEPHEGVASIAEALPEEEALLARLHQEAEQLLEQPPSIQRLKDGETQWERRIARLDEWLATISQRAADLDTHLEHLRTEERVWTLTKDTATEMELPEASVQQVQTTLTAIDREIGRLGERRSEVLTLQAAILQLRTQAVRVLEQLRLKKRSEESSLLSLDSPPLWTVLASVDAESGIGAQTRAFLQAEVATLSNYAAEETLRIVLHGLFLAVVFTLLVILGRKASRWAHESEALHTIVALLGRPPAAALLIAYLVDGWFHPRAPEVWHGVISIVGIGGVLGLLPAVTTARHRLGLWLLAAVYVLARIWRAVPDGTGLDRLVLLLVGLVGCGGSLWLVRRLTTSPSSGGAAFRGLLRLLLRVGAVILIVGIVLNVVGIVALGGLLTTGVVWGIYAAIILWLVALVVEGLVALLLQSDTARVSRMVQRETPTIVATARRTIRFLAVFTWIATTLSGFTILGWTRAQVAAIFGARLAVGDFSIALADVILFFLAIWVSFRISRLLRFVLDEDVLPRVTLPRGVPHAISRMAHYAVLLLGFLVAIAAAGIDLNKFALLAGAFGVGLGFGLQTVVSNFVAGLILLFERPIQKGDKVQLGDTAQVGGLSGRVQTIGLRASTIRTWQGAEVIVPNNDLLASKLVNWTLSDERRRMEIKMGVAYGTEPEAVQELLLKVAGEHPEVLDNPAPSALFRGFGENALLFELWAWTVQDFVRVQSELSVGIHRALKESGFRIPLPQRDVHIRSGASKGGPADGDERPAPQ